MSQSSTSPIIASMLERRLPNTGTFIRNVDTVYAVHDNTLIQQLCSKQSLPLHAACHHYHQAAIRSITHTPGLNLNPNTKAQRYILDIQSTLQWPSEELILEYHLLVRSTMTTYRDDRETPLNTIEQCIRAHLQSLQNQKQITPDTYDEIAGRYLTDN